MSDDMLTRLQAMYTSGEIRGHICSQIPSGRLESGWVERSLVAKGLDNNISPSVNKQLLTITDRGVRLFTNNMNLTKPGTFGMLILGEPGLRPDNFVFLLGDIRISSGITRLAISAYSDNLSPDRTVTVFFRHGLGLPVNPLHDEPTTDYVEQIREDGIAGIVTEALALRIPQAKFVPDEWIQNGMSSTEASEEVPLCTGQLKEHLSQFARVVTKWILSVELLKSFKAPTLLVIMGNVSDVHLVLWDGKNRMASFVTLQSNNFQSPLLRYIHSLWPTPEASMMDHATSDSAISMHSLHEATPAAAAQSAIHEPSSSGDVRPTTPDSVNMRELESLLQDVAHKINSIPVKDLSLRISRLEQRIENITAQVVSGLASSRDRVTDEQTVANQVTLSLKALVDRLEDMSQRLSSLEERVRSLINNVERKD